jgi:sugar/nucleoside kinase (ribokinase family)
VLGDLMLDVVLAPDRAIQRGTDVPGRVGIRQGGSAANTARWLGRLGVRTQLICAVGRDGAGRSLVEQVRSDDVTVRVTRVAGQRTGRIGVIVSHDGERSFVADRRAADGIRPEDVKPEWFDGVDLLHLPAYSLLGEPLGQAGLRAVELAHQRQALVTLDLASSAPLLAKGRRAARDLVRGVSPEVLFASEREAEALLGGYGIEGLVEYAHTAVVKRGARGATVIMRDDGAEDAPPDSVPSETTPLERFEVAAETAPAADTTGAGDAFDAGFIAAWLAARAAGHLPPVAIHRAVLAGHRTAARHLRSSHPELPPG